MKISSLLQSIVLLFLLLGSPFFALATSSPDIDLDAKPSLTNTTQDLSPSSIEDMVYPTAVRVIQHVSGSALIPSFLIDSETGKIAIDRLKDPVEVENISEYIISTGFFVSSDGMIMTTAHGVSDTMIKLALVHSFIEESLKEALGEDDVRDEMALLFSDQSIEFILSNTTFNVTKDIVVVDPSISPDSIQNDATILDLGIPATIVVANNDFYKQGANVALINIPGNNYPYVPFSDERVLVGQRVYVLDVNQKLAFDTVADIARDGFYNFQIRDVVVVRNEVSSTTSMYLTNNELIPQTAGSPVLNSSGEVVGLSVFDGLGGLVNGGGMDMYILGRADIEETIPQLVRLQEQERLYSDKYKEGLQAQKDLQCEVASTAFDVAVVGDNPFMERARYDTYINQCLEDIQLSGVDRGGFVNDINDIFAGRSVLDWALLSGAVVLIVIIIVLFMSLLKRLSPQKKKLGKVIPRKVEDRPDEVKIARRKPMSESLPLNKKESEHKTSKDANELPVKQVQKKEVEVSPKGANVVTKESRKKDAGESDLPEKTSGKDAFYTVPAQLPRQYEGDEPKETKAPEENKIPKEVPDKDKGLLAGMWPDKYGKSKDSASSAVARSPMAGESKDRVVPEVLRDAVTYVRDTKARGFKDEDIASALREAGWKEVDIKNAFTFISE